MKAILIILTFLSITSKADIINYTCISKDIRQNGSDVYGAMELRFDLVKEEGKVFLEDVMGAVTVSQESELFSNDVYYAIFSFNEIDYNKNYKPVKYKNHFQFPNFDDFRSNRHDGGGFWGELVVENSPSLEMINAHYIFQSGDHMGGTVDLTCKRSKY